MQRTLFFNGKVWARQGAFYDAFGVNGNRFDFTGSTEEAMKINSDYDEAVDLNKRLVLPGFIDGHLHLCHGSLMSKRFDAGKITAVEELKSALSVYAEKNASSKWILGANINLTKVFNDPKMAQGNLLDPIFDSRPLFIANFDHHSGVCNTQALEKSGLIKRLNQFSSSEIIKDSNGKPTGIVKEKALEYIRENITLPSIEEKCRAVEGIIRMLHSFGITSISDITHTEDIEVYNCLYMENKLKLRINSYLPLEEYLNIDTHFESAKKINRDYFAIRGYKAYYDGALGSETALFSENYRGKNHKGYETNYVTNEILERYADEIDKQGGQLIIHAIGDLAVTRVLDLYEDLKTNNGARDRRHRIEHAQHINAKDLPRFRLLGIIASVQPLHLKYDIESVKSKLADSLVPTTHNYKKLIYDGAVVNFGTDFPIVEANPFETIKMAVTRNDGSGSFWPENCIDINNCLRAYTINNAYSNFNEKELGSIIPGKLADFVIMEDDLFDMLPADIGTARVWKTFIDGVEVYGAS